VSASRREPVILGAADGLVIALGLAVGLIAAKQPGASVWHGGLADGEAELVGMAAAVWLSGGSRRSAVACGLASLAGCVLPVAPYLFTGGSVALGLMLGLVFAVGCVIVWLRPQRGLTAVAQTFGVLVAAAVLTGGTALL
jgi:VIT1/CCC1 family predicted Fe2+/Mn2+ transporter